MTSVDFNAAQQRLEERVQDRAAVARAHHESQRSIRASNALSRLPLPLQVLGQRGIDVWDTIKGREGTRPAFRVGQLDAELLDEELIELLRGQVGEGLKYFGVRFLSLPRGFCDLTLGSNIYGMIGLPRSYWGYELPCSNCPSGTTTLLTALRFKIYSTQMLDTAGPSLPFLPNGRKSNTVCSPLVADTAGQNGRTGLQTKKEAMRRCHTA